jgi:hypothetical protein
VHLASSAMDTYEAVLEARFCVLYRGAILKVFKLAVSKVDSSLYLFPYAPAGMYYFGRLSIPAGERSASVPFDEQETSEETPKLSIHESGATPHQGRRSDGRPDVCITLFRTAWRTHRNGYMRSLQWLGTPWRTSQEVRLATECQFQNVSFWSVEGARGEEIQQIQRARNSTNPTRRAGMGAQV